MRGESWVKEKPGRQGFGGSFSFHWPVPPAVEPYLSFAFHWPVPPVVEPYLGKC